MVDCFAPCSNIGKPFLQVSVTRNQSENGTIVFVYASEHAVIRWQLIARQNVSSCSQTAVQCGWFSPVKFFRGQFQNGSM